MKDRVELLELFDCYHKLLTENEITTFKDYYEDDLSLAEIAENKSISRSAIQKTLKVVEEKLTDYEKKLGVLKLKKTMGEFNE